MKKHSAFLAIGGAVVLFATAAFHATGFESVSQQIAASTASPFVKTAAPTLWLFFSWHLVVLAVASLAALRLGPATRPVLIGCALVVLGDFLWVLSIAGLFAGTLLLLLASALLFVGGSLAPRELRSKAAPRATS